MRAHGEAVSITIGEQTIKVGEANVLDSVRGSGRTTARLWFKPYWPGLMHAMALMADARKKTK